MELDKSDSVYSCQAVTDSCQCVGILSLIDRGKHVTWSVRGPFLGGLVEGRLKAVDIMCLSVR
jgi:hypothetical protein